MVVSIATSDYNILGRSIIRIINGQMHFVFYRYTELEYINIGDQFSKLLKQIVKSQNSLYTRFERNKQPQ